MQKNLNLDGIIGFARTHFKDRSRPRERIFLMLLSAIVRAHTVYEYARVIDPCD